MARKKATVEAGPNDEIVDLYEGDTLEDVRYGNWKQAKDGRYFLPAYLGGSDYSGSLVERSNYRKFTEEFKDGQDEWWTNAPGGHGTFAILIDTQSVPADVEEEVAEFLNALYDYPLANEELHSEMETEASNEAWTSWAERDFKKGVEKRFAEFELDLDDVPDDKIRELFEKAREAANEYWENQQGGDMYIQIGKIVDQVEVGDLEEIRAKMKSIPDILDEFANELARQRRISYDEAVKMMGDDTRDVAGETNVDEAEVIEWVTETKHGMRRAR